MNQLMKHQTRKGDQVQGRDRGGVVLDRVDATDRKLQFSLLEEEPKQSARKARRTR